MGNILVALEEYRNLRNVAQVNIFQPDDGSGRRYGRYGRTLGKKMRDMDDGYKTRKTKDKYGSMAHEDPQERLTRNMESCKSTLEKMSAWPRSSC